MTSTLHSEKLYNKAKTLFPGGVNSPVRAFKSVGGTPLFITKADGPYVWDADQNQYIDFCASWGPMILGHNNNEIRTAIELALPNGLSYGAPTIQENELAELLISQLPHVDKIRFVSSGTEAVMSAVRLARGFTGRTKIIKFEGCYHGHSDYLLVKAGSGLVTFGESSSAGVPEAFAKETIVLPLNDLQQLENTFNTIGSDIACVIIEPIPANNGLLLQTRRFLLTLRNLCTQYGAVLLFDEVISGFRVGLKGAAGLYNITPDLVTFGKIIGGGLPVGAYGGKAEIMACVSPDGPVYQAGTLSGNPIAMTAGKATITALLNRNFYNQLVKKTAYFRRIIKDHIESNQYPLRIFQVGSIFWLSFSNAPRVQAAHEINPDSMSNFKKLFHYLLQNGVYFGPSGYEVGFISAAHSYELLSKAAKTINDGLDYIYRSE